MTLCLLAMLLLSALGFTWLPGRCNAGGLGLSTGKGRGSLPEADDLFPGKDVAHFEI